MINNIDNRTNDNFISDYINYHFMKEKKKFTKLKYNLTFNNSKKASKIDSYKTIESKHNKQLPYLNYKSPLENNLRNKIPKNCLSYIKRKSKTIEMFNNKLSPEKMNINIFNKLSEKENNPDSFFHSQRENFTTNEKTDKIKLKKMLYKDKNDFKIINKKSSKNLKIELDKELIIVDKTKSLIKDTNDIKKIRRENRAKKDEEEEKIIDTLYIGNHIINNCKIKNKIIYDIRPLNKTKERASCHFDYEDNNKQLNNEIKNNENEKKQKNVENNIHLIKYFRNSNSQVYSTNSYFHNDIFKFYSNEEMKNNNKINTVKEKLIKYEFSEKELINKLKINDNIIDNKNNNSNIKYITINNIKKKLSYPKFFRNSIKGKTSKNNLDYIDLSVLGRDLELNKNNNKNKLKTFFAKDEENVMRGEKIKFLKTCYEVKIVKPIFSQHAYEIKPQIGTKKFFSPKRIKFPVHHFNLDILKETNIKKINDTQNYLFGLRKNIKIHLNNLANHLDKEIKENEN